MDVPSPKRPRTRLQIRLPSIIEEELDHLDEDDTPLDPSADIEYTPSGQKSPSHSEDAHLDIEPLSPETSSPRAKKKAKGWPKESTMQKGKKADCEIMDIDCELVFFVPLGALKGQQGHVSMSMVTNLPAALEKIYKVMGCEEFCNKLLLMEGNWEGSSLPTRY
ncbi:hypothetical protein K439DRAFT_1612984 [Ramaria rubella]|nr:hypothetical protein K439DRAFT_1612984 [Ramaria rubella]